MKTKTPLYLAWLLLFFSNTSFATALFYVTTSMVNFGYYRPFAKSDQLGRGAITVHCKNKGQSACNQTININLSGGACDESPYARAMTNESGSLLRYNIYQKNNNLTAWCGTQAFLVNSSSSDAIFNIYGRIPAGQMVEVGTYTDTVSIVMNY